MPRPESALDARSGRRRRVATAKPDGWRIDPATQSSTCVSPPANSTTGSTTAPDLIGAAADGFGAFQDAQRRSLARLSRSNPGGFALFLEQYLAQETPQNSAITHSELLPMPRPYSPPSGRPPRSSRRRARWAATRAAMVMANQAAAAVSWLACGSPSDTQVRVVLSRLSAARPSRAQHEAAARFLARARPFAAGAR